MNTYHKSEIDTECRPAIRIVVKYTGILVRGIGKEKCVPCRKKNPAIYTFRSKRQTFPCRAGKGCSNKWS